MKGSSLHTGKASFKAKNICPNEFSPRLSENGVTLNCCKLLVRLNILLEFGGKQVLFLNKDLRVVFLVFISQKSHLKHC